MDLKIEYLQEIKKLSTSSILATNVPVDTLADEISMANPLSDFVGPAALPMFGPKPPPLPYKGRRAYLRGPPQVADPRKWAQQVGGLPTRIPMFYNVEQNEYEGDEPLEPTWGAKWARWEYQFYNVQGPFLIDFDIPWTSKADRKHAKKMKAERLANHATVAAVLKQWTVKNYNWPKLQTADLATNITTWWKTNNSKYLAPEMVLQYYLKTGGVIPRTGKTARWVMRTTTVEAQNAYAAARRAINQGKQVLVNVQDDLLAGESVKDSSGQWTSYGEPESVLCKTVFELNDAMKTFAEHIESNYQLQQCLKKEHGSQDYVCDKMIVKRMQITKYTYVVVEPTPIVVNGVTTLPNAIIDNTTEPVDADFAQYGCFVGGVLHQLAKRDKNGKRVVMPATGKQERANARGVLDTKMRFNEHWTAQEQIKYKRWTGREILIDMDHRDYTLEQIEDVAKKFSINIDIRDNECNGWRCYKYAPDNAKAKNTVNVRFYYYNGHLYNIHKGITIVPYPRIYSHIKPVVNNRELPSATYYTRDAWQTAVLECTTEYFVAYVKNPIDELNTLTELALPGSVAINSKRGTICNEITGAIGATKVIVRVAWSYYEGITEQFPAWCPSIASMAMYDFRKHIKTELPCVQNKLTYNFMKNMCKPLVEIDPFNSLDRGGYIITIDMTRAYTNRCSNLYMFSGEPVWEDYTLARVGPGFYLGTRGDEIITCSYERYVRLHDVQWKYLCRADYISDAVSDWAQSVRERYNVRVAGTQIDKAMVNTLIGMLHPAYGEVTQHAVYSYADLCMFLLSSTNKSIMRVDSIGDLYAVEYVYRDEAHCHSKQAVYIPALIIERCKNDIEDIIDWAKSHGGEITGVMTDCVMFWVPNMIDLSKYKNDRYHVDVYDYGVFINPGTYCLGDYKDGEHPKVMKRGSLREARDLYSYISEHSRLVATPREKRIGMLPQTMYKDGFNVEENVQTCTVIQADAGVGKTHHVLEHYTSGCLLLAPTGVSASGLGVCTMHSLLGLDVDGVRTAMESATKIQRKSQRIIDAHTIVVDEAYYCTYDVMRRADMVLRLVCNSNRPFAGKHVVMVGDFWQLTLSDQCAVNYMRSVCKNIIEVGLPTHDKMRCNASYLADVKVLQTEERLDDEVYMRIQSRCSRVKHDAVWLTFTNADRKKLNGAKPVHGDPIMLRDNIDIPAGFFNGTRGVLMIKGDVHYIVVGEKHRKVNVKQYKKCLAMTIHKSQGCTLTNVNILLDLNMPNINRLLYVALTRVHNYENVYLEYKKG